MNSALLSVPAWLWAVFAAVVLATLILDLGVFHRNAHTIGMREAVTWSAVWIALALLFNLGILIQLGPTPALEFLTGFLVEKSLSVDNIFVFAVVLSYFSVPSRYQHKVLFWGIFGAMALRLILILLGAALIARFHWVLYIFGAFLLYAGARMAFERGVEVHPEQNPVVQLLRRFVPIEPRYHGGRFVVRLDGRRFMTPLLVVVAVVETTDILFAFDSIPAIFGITTNPFIVYTSNIFAILGLRALYFVLASMLERFRYLRFGLAVVLVFVGVKMLISSWAPIPTHMALAAVVGILIGTVLLSLYWRVPERETTGGSPPAPGSAPNPSTGSAPNPSTGDVVDPQPGSLSE